ncbi:metallophosphoesterase [Agarivorans sp. 1_MG-2023]|uniref:metallophosphoesterase family protein n=1 Tax=Agarivorans sp. 1_MG-2023 TaxID=3062634 RepID=UPI0026E32089|nr:metallophosphoesterase [Agarivorans sp. 1_MG-2023]MDO6766081.1 metallophosphoesterase [Agarivorans sp. 1_MG-2023]
MRFIEVSEDPFYELEYRSSGQGGKVREVVLPFYKAIVDELPDGITSFVISSDLQGREQNKKTNRLVGEVVAEELSLLSELGEIPSISFVALAGDFYDYPQLHKVGGTGDVTNVWNAFAKEFPFVVGVLGNHDIVKEQHLASNTIVLDGSSKKYLGVRIGGVSGIIGRSDRNQRKSKQEFMSALAKVTTVKNDLILLHQGPEDTSNSQLGDLEITNYLLSKSKSIVAFGHSHWSKPFIEIGKNQVLNVDKRLYLVTTANSVKA